MGAQLDQKLELIQKWFETSERTLAFAESCTGGLMSSRLAARPGVSSFYLGSVVSYHREVKEEILSVPASLISTLGEVSIPVAISMARGVRKALKSDWAVAITGIAGPSGGSVDKPVGTVCFAIVGPGFEEAKEVRFEATNRERIQLESVEFAISFLWDSIHS